MDFSTQAETYFSERLHSSSWTEANSSDKSRALIMAERMIFSTFDFVEGAVQRDETGEVTACVLNVARAVFEQALYLLTIDPTSYPEVLALGISNANAGASATFDRSMIAPYISLSAIRMMGKSGTFYDRAADSGNVESIALGHGG